MTDKSVLFDLLMHKKSNVIIYYHNQKSRQEKISNLIRMLGAENYNQKSSRISFKEQQAAVEYTDKDKEFGFERLFKCLELSDRDYKQLYDNAVNNQSCGGYAQTLVDLFFRDNFDVLKDDDEKVQDDYLDENRKEKHVEYLREVCTEGNGDFGMIKDACRFEDVTIKEELEDYFLNADNYLSRLRWKHVKKTLGIE